MTFDPKRTEPTKPLGEPRGGRPNRYAMGPSRWVIAAVIVVFVVGLFWWGAAVNKNVPVAERPASTPAASGVPSDSTVGTAPQGDTAGGGTPR